MSLVIWKHNRYSLLFLSRARKKNYVSCYFEFSYFVIHFLLSDLRASKYNSLLNFVQVQEMIKSLQDSVPSLSCFARTEGYILLKRLKQWKEENLSKKSSIIDRVDNVLMYWSQFSYRLQLKNQTSFFLISSNHPTRYQVGRIIAWIDVSFMLSGYGLYVGHVMRNKRFDRIEPV